MSDTDKTILIVDDEPAVSTRLNPARVKMARNITSSSASSTTIRMVLT